MTAIVLMENRLSMLTRTLVDLIKQHRFFVMVLECPVTVNDIIGFIDTIEDRTGISCRPCAVDSTAEEAAAIMTSMDSGILVVDLATMKAILRTGSYLPAVLPGCRVHVHADGQFTLYRHL